MKYETEYRLRISYDRGVDPETTGKAILECILGNSAKNGPDMQIGELPYEPVRCRGHWYDYEKDMKQVARQFPGCSIILHGKGEEDDDEWENEFKGNSVRYRNIVTAWSEWQNEFEGRYDAAYYSLHIEYPKDRKSGEVFAEIIEWMRTSSPDWAQVFDLNVSRTATLECVGPTEWFGYVQMQDLSRAFPSCIFELRCVPVAKQHESVYRIENGEGRFRKTEHVWTDWSTWF